MSGRRNAKRAVQLLEEMIFRLDEEAAIASGNKRPGLRRAIRRLKRCIQDLRGGQSPSEVLRTAMGVIVDLVANNEM